MNANTLPATLNEYIAEARSNTEDSYWGKCIMTADHITEESAPKAEFIVPDNAYVNYAEALADGIEYGLKMCRSCAIKYWGGDFEFYVLARRSKVSLVKEFKCSGPHLTNWEMGEKCTRFGRQYIVVNGNRTWFCADHIWLMCGAGFETFRILRNGKVECTTAETLKNFHRHM